MAFDGITIANITKELNDKLLGGRIRKIAQPENDELLLTIKSAEGTFRLLISASASLPLIYLTENNKPSPLTAPNFCMLLRKHIENGKIVGISQPGLERIIRFDVEHLDELGDLRHKTLVVEIMGKHSNIIFCDEQSRIVDSIKHVSLQMSSVREVLPGRTYFIPVTQEKADPLELSLETFTELIGCKSTKLAKAIYTSYTGISPVAANEVVFRTGLNAEMSGNALSEMEMLHLYKTFSYFMEDTKAGNFAPQIVYNGKTPVEYSALPMTMYEDFESVSDESISKILETYYAERNTVTRIRQRSVDLRKIVQTALERSRKKYDIQAKQLKDTEKRDTYRIYGELLTTYGYSAEPGAKSLDVLNYYTNEEITIPLDPQLTALENAKKYFDKYAKLKRTYEAVTELLEETGSEVEHLDSISTALDIALSEEDLVEIKEELMEYGYIKKRHPGGKKPKITSKPFHYISSDGYHMYVGKNNFQNEELTFKFATGNDWWFHAKGVPGSHVIVKAEGDSDMPDATFEEAGRLAAYYSQNRGNEKVEIDYIQKKHVKKPKGGKPGFVVYYTNYSLIIDSDISKIQQL
ncbi:MAG: NFACT RNA binding domain-containing protein [Lachnospiraceae bacterium]|nr:NFACT RNA binding domain-containing protein [Lachnospiraceae bacterium]